MFGIYLMDRFDRQCLWISLADAVAGYFLPSLLVDSLSGQF
jgi:hypothetical protein